MIKLNLTAAELDRLVGAIENLPQEHLDRELMVKLWAAQKRAKKRKIVVPQQLNQLPPKPRSCPHGHNPSTCCWCNPSLPDPMS